MYKYMKVLFVKLKCIKETADNQQKTSSKNLLSSVLLMLSLVALIKHLFFHTLLIPSVLNIQSKHTLTKNIEDRNRTGTLWPPKIPGRGYFTFLSFPWWWELVMHERLKNSQSPDLFVCFTNDVQKSEGHDTLTFKTLYGLGVTI